MRNLFVALVASCCIAAAYSQQACNPCNNGGSLSVSGSTMSCTCASGWEGTFCETNTDDCVGHGCQNGATCVDGVDTYTCTCLPGYTGQYCETDNTACSPNPCLNGGSCTPDGAGGHTCSCVTGYTGNNCQNTVVDGQWSAFGSWGTCSVTCGSGSQSRTRQCDNPAPAFGGANCPGSNTETRSCNAQNCAVDGQWSPYGSWSTCSLTCGSGTRSRTRQCNNPAPAFGGANCPGSNTENGSCNVQNCAGNCVDPNGSRCNGKANGNYQHCGTCNKYIACSNGLLYEMPCAPTGPVWDDALKRCEITSTTCP